MDMVMLKEKLIFLTSIFIFVLCSLPPAVSFAQGTITYIENFNDNSNGWWVGDTDFQKCEIGNGRYSFEYKKHLEKGEYTGPKNVLSIEEGKDFQIETKLRFVKGGADVHAIGFAWGFKKGDGDAYHSFLITTNGKYAIGKYSGNKYTDIIPWTKSSYIKMGQSENSLKIVRSGDTVKAFINNQQTTFFPFEPFFGNKIDFFADPPLIYEAYHLSATIITDAVPAGWSVLNVGNFYTRVLWDNPKDPGKIKAVIHKSSDLTIKAPVVGNNAAVSVNVKAPPAADGSSSGVYLQTPDDVIFRLERINTTKGAIARFSTSSGGKATGSREIALPSTDVSLKITRHGDVFKAIAVAEGHSIQVGSLKWPNLKPQQEVGIIAIYRTDNMAAPASLTYGFTDFYMGKP